MLHVKLTPRHTVLLTKYQNIKPVNGRPAATGIGAICLVADTGGAAPVGAGIVRTSVATSRVPSH